MHELRKLYHQTGKADLHTRCQMILLSAEGYRVAEIARLTFFEEDSVKILVDQEPRQIGKPFSVWTCLDLVKELAEKKLAEVCTETVRRHLRKLEYRVIRPFGNHSSTHLRSEAECH